MKKDSEVRTEVIRALAQKARERGDDVAEKVYLEILHRGDTPARRKTAEQRPQYEFRDPILRVLYRLGGEGRRRAVLAGVEELIGSELSDHDFADIPSGGDIRWQKSAEWEVHQMRKDGLLKQASHTERGIWALTKLGREQTRTALGSIPNRS